jgi:hypothetical protein
MGEESANTTDIDKSSLNNPMLLFI